MSDLEEYFRKNVELDGLRTKINGLHRANDTLMGKNIDLEFELSELKMKHSRLQKRHDELLYDAMDREEATRRL